MSRSPFGFAVKRKYVTLVYVAISVILVSVAAISLTYLLHLVAEMLKP